MYLRFILRLIWYFIQQKLNWIYLLNEFIEFYSKKIFFEGGGVSCTDHAKCVIMWVKTFLELQCQPFSVQCLQPVNFVTAIEKKV